MPFKSLIGRPSRLSSPYEHKLHTTVPQRNSYLVGRLYFVRFSDTNPSVPKVMSKHWVVSSAQIKNGPPFTDIPSKKHCRYFQPPSSYRMAQLHLGDTS